MKEIYDPAEESQSTPLRSNYAEYRASKHPSPPKDRLSRANKIFLIDLAVIALFGMMIFLFRPYLISPNRIGDWTFSASASMTEDNWIRIIVTAKPVSEIKTQNPPEVRVSLFYEGNEWNTDDFLNQTNVIPIEDGLQWILYPFPVSQTEKIAVRIENESESAEWIVSLDKL